jgi:glutathione S-transferase
VAEQTLPGSLRRASGPATRYATIYTQLRFGVGDTDAAAMARTKIVAAFDRLEAELDANGTGYLVGEDFGVADLTAAALLYPVVLPVEGPTAIDGGPPAGLEEFRAPLAERPGYVWVEEMFRRHRFPHPSATPAGAPSATA